MPTVLQYDKELNPRQWEAVRSTEGPHLIIAGAGSGKTRVLVFRTAYLVDRGVDPAEILLLTFTRRAASQMLERAALILDDRCRDVAGGTFHSFAHRMLRKHGEAIGLARNFTILDEADSENIVESLRKRMDKDKLDRRFPKKKAILSIISKSINKECLVDDIVFSEYPQFMDSIDDINFIKREYANYKKNLSLVDYDDLLVDFRRLLSDVDPVREALSGRFRYIMVDEYQDTNKIQADIVELLAGKHGNVMVVGDDSQSIYSFRGARFENIIQFPHTFPNTKVIVLEENYRSSQPILDLTNAIIVSARQKYEKILFTRKEGNQPPVFVNPPNENGQSRYIVSKIQSLRSQGVRLNEIAVLFRSGWHSNDLEIELAGSGIPFRKYGGQKFVEAAHIKDVLSLLRIIYNKNNEISWARILTMFPGLGEKTALSIVEGLRGKSDVSFEEKHLKKYKDLGRLATLLKNNDPLKDSPQEILNRALEFYMPILTSQYDDYDKRINDLESMEKISTRYESLEELLSDMALEPPEKSLVDSGGADGDQQLTLSTIHSAKGLEWHTVFLIFVAEGYLPSYKSLDSASAIEEERRLFYVAATRAKENLFLLRPQVERVLKREGGGGQPYAYTRISRFLGEGKILQELVQFESNNTMFYQ